MNNPEAVPIPFSLIDSLGNPDIPTAAEIANLVVAAVNRPDVSSQLAATAGLSSGAGPLTTGEAEPSDVRINILGDVIVNDDSGFAIDIVRSTLRGDNNRVREQGVLIVEQSRFLFNEDYGVELAGGETATIGDVETPSVVRFPRNLVELNTEELLPGVVVQNNVIAFNDAGSLRVEGFDVPEATGVAPQRLDTLINNTMIGGTITDAGDFPPAIFNGIAFSSGAVSFADRVVEYEPDATAAPPRPAFRDATEALGAPDVVGRGPEPVDGDATVSLGLGGTLTLQFVDNLLTGSGDSSPDLVVFETGAIESVLVEVSRDGLNFAQVGTTIVDGLIDIDAAGFGPQDRFAFVRLTDLRGGDVNAEALGADIDAVGALSTVAVERFEPSGVGIELVGQTSPTVLNNIIANQDTAISATGGADPVLGGNTYYRNVAELDGTAFGQFPQVISDAEVLFVRPAELVFTPIAGAPIIDSSIASLNERASLSVVKQSVGIASSPTIAPQFDNNGILRVDDPLAEPPSGIGDRVFIDRGATDRGDTIGPRVVLLTPQAPDLGLDGGAVTVSDPPNFFEFQFIDGLAPADITPGVGIDDDTIDAGTIILLENNVPLIEGRDYRFGYNPTDNVVRLTPVAGVFNEDSTYTIRILDGDDQIIRPTAGNLIADGGLLELRTRDNALVRLEFETGFRLRVPAALVESGPIDGVTIEIFDGTATTIFELDDDDSVDPGNIAVTIDGVPRQDTLAAAVAAAINAAPVDVTASSLGSVIQIDGFNPLTTVTVPGEQLSVDGTIGTRSGFGFIVPSEDGVVTDVDDGDTFTLRRGDATPVTFEFVSDGVLDTVGAIGIPLNAGASLDQIANAIVAAVAGSSLGLTPVNAGFGRVQLGGDTTFSLDVSDSSLIPVDLPGQTATIPVRVPLDASPAQVAGIVSNAIASAGIVGATLDLIDDRVFIGGIADAIGVGAVEASTVTDRVGNPLQPNTLDGSTELLIFVGGGFDFGDAPAYDNTVAPPAVVTRDVQIASSRIIEGFSLGRRTDGGASVTAEAQSLLPNRDRDDGVSIGVLRTGFSTNVSIDVVADPGQTFFVDAWFDWNGNGLFEPNEAAIRGASGNVPGRLPMLPGTNNFSVRVPADARIGNTYARVRLSDQAGILPTGDRAPGALDPSAGEVEDYPILVQPNGFQNPVNRFDVNASGFVTPLDALEVINLLRRQGTDTVQLASSVLPLDRARFPDVDGDGNVAVDDALAVIDEIRRLGSFGQGEQIGEGESIDGQQFVGLNGSINGDVADDFRRLASTYVPVAGGVMATTLTLLGDETPVSETTVTPTTLPATLPAPVSVITDDQTDRQTPATSTDVLAGPAVISADDWLESLASDQPLRTSVDDDVASRDDIFARF